MKTGYDSHFKKAQKIAAQGTPVRPQYERKVQIQDAKTMAQELRKSLRPKMRKKVKAKFPWKLAIGSFLGLLIAAAGLWKAEEVEYFVKHIEISMLGSAHAADTKAEAPATNKAAAAGKEEKKEEAPIVKKEYTEEEINHFARLNERKRELDAREEELNRMDQEIQAQKAELEKKLAELENTRRNISSVLEERVKGDDQKVENLVQVYSNMKPQQAAKAFEEMDEALAVEILGRMKKKNAAEIMNLVKSEKVKVLSEKYTGYKRN